MKRSFDALQAAERLERKGLYDEALGKCRLALEPFFEMVETLVRIAVKDLAVSGTAGLANYDDGVSLRLARLYVPSGCVYSRMTPIGQSVASLTSIPPNTPISWQPLAFFI